MAFFGVLDKVRSHQKKQDEPEVSGHLNYMAGVSYDVSSPITRLRLAAATCFFGEPMYYQPSEKEDTRAKRAMAVPSLTDEQRTDRKSVV